MFMKFYSLKSCFKNGIFPVTDFFTRSTVKVTEFPLNRNFNVPFAIVPVY
jgi:hypothetical protein